jgi:CubicO group peptidase (beta-lactamase class C family)
MAWSLRRRRCQHRPSRYSRHAASGWEHQQNLHRRRGPAAGREQSDRVGSISKTFTAAAVLQQVENSQIGLDTPIGHYLPQLVPGERGNRITVRMLINHTSGLAEYLPYAYPSFKALPALADTTPESVDGGKKGGCTGSR